MTRHKKPNTYAPQATDSPAVRRRKQERMMVQHIDQSGNYSIALWRHRWSHYVMDDRPGLWMLYRGGKNPSVDGDTTIAAWDTFAKKWSVFVRLTDDDAAELIEAVIEQENMPF